MRFSCPKCGANLTYQVKKQNVICEYCGSEFELEEIQLEEEEEKNYDKYICGSCGAEILTTGKMGIIACLYCGGKEFIREKANKEYILEGIIPFELEKQFFIESYTYYINNSQFVNLELKEELKENLKSANVYGMYYPYYFDEKFFLNEHVVLQKIMEEVLPFDFRKKKKMHPAYLDGFLARPVKQKFEEDYFKLKKPLFYWVPLWIAEFEGVIHKKTYIVMNGETGEMAGNFYIEKEFPMVKNLDVEKEIFKERESHKKGLIAVTVYFFIIFFYLLCIFLKNIHNVSPLGVLVEIIFLILMIRFIKKIKRVDHPKQIRKYEEKVTNRSLLVEKKAVLFHVSSKENEKRQKNNK